METYLVRDLSLAPKGRQKIEWARRHMPILNLLRKRYATKEPLQGKKIAVSVHLEAKTAYLAMTLKELGAKVAVTGSNPLSTQDDVAAALVEEGVSVFAWHNATEEEYFSHLASTLKIGPDLLIDDGGDLVYLSHTKYQELLPGIIGGCEETTTGVNRLRAMAHQGELRIPMIAVNDAYCKHLFDNRYGTGQSTWDGIMRNTNLLVAGKNVVVAGYGWCGKGVALRGKGLGARIIVCEVDPIRALEAMIDGYEVMPAIEAAAKGDIFITVTGCAGVFREEHFKVMKNGAILANAGHFDVEIDKRDLERLSVKRREIRENITEYCLADGRCLYLLGAGRLVNLAAGDGHPVEIMDLSFALQVVAILRLKERGAELKPGVYSVPAELDRLVAELAIASRNVAIDTLSKEQEEYLAAWRRD